MFLYECVHVCRLRVLGGGGGGIWHTNPLPDWPIDITAEH
jgi:hypothetical protein